MAQVVGQKRAREVWMLTQQYTAQQAMEMGLVNSVVPHDELEKEVDSSNGLHPSSMTPPLWPNSNNA